MKQVVQNMQPSRRSQRSAQDILALLKAYDNSEGITVKDFCRRNGFSDATFYTWRKRYYNKQQQTRITKSFVPVKLTPSSYVTANNEPLLFAEVKGIRLYHFVSADYLKALLSGE
jgi:Transposase